MIRRPSGCRILLVEDNDALRALTRHVLEQEGYRVDCARSAEEAIELVERHTYDLVLTDFSLPSRTGGWLLREAQARELLRGAATLVVTADASPELDAGQSVVFKPVDFDTFLPQIRAILTEDLHFSPAAQLEPGRREPLDLVLYVSPESVAGLAARKGIEQAIARYAPGAITFRVSDVSRDPEGASQDRIIFTPTLVKRSPAPACWTVGHLATPGLIDNLLSCWTTWPIQSATPRS